MPALQRLTPLASALLRHSFTPTRQALLLGLALAAPYAAQVQAQAVSFDIPAQSLSSALQVFGQQADVQVLYSPEDVQGVRNQAVRGHLEPEQAIAELLKGTGVSYSLQGNSLTLRRQGAGLELDATNVNARALGSVTENSGSYTTGPMKTATKMALTQRETPQSVTVITRQRMDDQGMSSLNDAVKNTPGLTVQKWGPERTTFMSRGFQVDNLMYDGLPTTISRYTPDVTSSVDLAIYDRVEIVRGATGLMQGAGNPSAAINLVRKRPTKETQASITGLAGSWDNYRSELDLSGSLNEQGTLRGRTVMAYQTKNSFQDVVDAERILFYAIGEADLNDSTTLTLGVSNQKDNNTNDWGGIPTAADGSDLHLSRSTFLGNKWAYWNQKNTSAFAELEHRFDNDWKLRMAATKVWADLDFLGSYNSYVPTGLNQYTGDYRYKTTQDTYDVFADGPFSLLGRTHELVVGASSREEHFNGHGGSGGAVPSATNVDPYNWSHSTVPKPNYDMYRFHQKTNSSSDSVYVTTRLNIADPLKVILGSRLDWYDYDVKTLSSKTQSGYSLNKELTKYAGVIYDLNANHSVYVSYTDIFKPQSELDASNKVLDPIKGKNYEIGLKGEYFDGALNASAAVFRIDQENRSYQINSSLCSAGMRACYDAAGEVRSEGIELEINGAITPDWQLAAGYTYAAAEYTKDKDPNKKGTLFDSKIPRHLFKLATSYQLPGQLNRWRVGGSLYRQNAIYSEGTHWRDNRSYRIEQEAYTLVDLMVAYKPMDNLQARVNLNNVFDKKYYQSIDLLEDRANIYGDPRNLALTVKYDF